MTATARPTAQEPESPAASQISTERQPEAPASATRPTRTPALGLPRVRWSRSLLLIVGLGIALAIAGVVAAGSGQLHVAPSEVLGSIVHKIGGWFGADIGSVPSHPRGEAALWNVRFPRVVLAAVVGGALGGAGAVLQAVFGNPLAEPSVIGVSGGAAVGACAVIVFGWSFFGGFTIAAVAFATGLATTLAIYAMSRHGGRTEVVTLVLMGIAVNAVTAAVIAFLVFLGDSAAREQIVFWQLGSFNGARWEAVRIVTPVVAVGLLGVMLLARQLDLLALGERSARHVGVNVERLRLISIVLVSLLIAAGVAFVGIIAFIGLIVPHLVRMLIGPSHRTLIPASVLGGAFVVVVADLAARTLVDYADLPIGMLTALVGGPFFFWMLYRTRASAGGWG